MPLAVSAQVELVGAAVVAEVGSVGPFAISMHLRPPHHFRIATAREESIPARSCPIGALLSAHPQQLPLLCRIGLSQDSSL